MATVGAAATQLRHALAISNTDLGLLVTVASLLAAVATLPFGVLADRVRRTWTLRAMIACWGAAMVWSATAGSFTTLLLGRRGGRRARRRRRRHLTGRIIVSAAAATGAVLLFIPAIFTRDLVAALPYLIGAACCLSAQNPPLDAARLDIMPPPLWGRAESIRTLLRSFAQALAPLLFGAVAGHVFGGGRARLQWTFAVMLVPLAASAALLYHARRTYPADVATAGGYRLDGSGRDPARR